MKFGNIMSRQQPARNRVTQIGELITTISNLFISGDFEVQLYTAQVFNQQSIQKIISKIQPQNNQTALNQLITINNEDDPQDKKDIKHQECLHFSPYAAILQLSTQQQEVINSQVYSTFNIEASQKMMRILKTLDIKNVLIAAQIKCSTKSERQLLQNLSFLHEIVRDFLSKIYLPSTQNQVDPLILDYSNILPSKTPQARNFFMHSRKSNSSHNDSKVIINEKTPQTATNKFRGKKLQNPLKTTCRIDDYNFLTSASTRRGQSNRSPLNLSMMSPSSNIDKAKLLRPNEYLNNRLVEESTNYANRIFTQMNHTRRAQSQVSSQLTHGQDTIKTNKLDYYLSDEEFYEAILSYNSTLKNLTKSHVIELKNLRSYPANLISLLSQIMMIIGKTNDCQSDIVNLIQKEQLKQLMYQIDPYQINIFVAQDVVKQIEKLDQQTHNTQQVSCVKYLREFLIAVCQMTIGKQLFKYNEGHLNDYILKIRQRKLRKIQDQNINSRQLQDLSPEIQINDLPKVTVSYRSPKSNGMPNITQGFTLMNRKLDNPFYEKKELSNTKQRQRSGHFLKPKHLILTDLKVLQPASKVPPSIPIFNLHETLPKNILRQHFDEVEIPDIDLYNFNDVTLSKFIKEHQDHHIEQRFSKNQIEEELAKLPDNPQDVLDYVTGNDPNQYPTQVLAMLAKQMRERRRFIYENQQKQLMPKRSTYRKPFNNLQ